MKTSLKLLLALICAININARCEKPANAWETYFEKYQMNGTFVLYNLSTGELQTHNTLRADSAFLPASTFKIPNSLFALEAGVINSVHDTLFWDGIKRPFSAWNRHHTIKSAITVSCVPCYQYIARKIGEQQMQHFLDTLAYGNAQIGSAIDLFWLEGALRISANQQIAFLERLVKNELPFSAKNQEIVKRIMISDSTNSYVMHSKTGTAMRVTPQIGWFVGYVETEKGTWAFAMNFNIEKEHEMRSRKLITYDILKFEGII